MVSRNDLALNSSGSQMSPTQIAQMITKQRLAAGAEQHNAAGINPWLIVEMSLNIRSANRTKALRDMKGNKQIVDIGQTEIPENYMLDARKLVGDGLARITVSADMALKEFGSGAGAMVSVSLTCGQDQDTIEKTIDLVTPDGTPAPK